jgi:uncharacterized membrane protein YeaQ/YmgE (transglycosylase-associated protein family)
MQQMSIVTVLSWMLCGLIVGLIARALVPGRQSMGPFLTMGLGIVGAILGGVIDSLIRGQMSDPFTFSGDFWRGWLLSILGAVVVLWAYVLLSSRRRVQ